MGQRLPEDIERSVVAGDYAGALAAWNALPPTEPGTPDWVDRELQHADLHVRFAAPAPAREIEARLRAFAAVDPRASAGSDTVAARAAVLERAWDEAEVRAWSARVAWSALGDAFEVARSVQLLGTVAARRSEHGRAGVLLGDAIGRWRSLGEEGQVARALNQLGYARYLMGAMADAVAAHREAALVAAGLGLVLVQATALEGVFFLSLERGHLAEARAAYEEFLRVAPPHWPVRSRFLMEGELAAAAGDLDSAGAAYRAVAELGGRNAAPGIVGLAEVALERDDLAGAAALVPELRTSAWSADEYLAITLALAAERGDVVGWSEALARKSSNHVGNAALAKGALRAARTWMRRNVHSLAARAVQVGLVAAHRADHADLVHRAIDLARSLPLGGPVPLGEWDLAQPIGEGGFGQVWRASAADGREAAIKVLAAEAAAESSRVVSFEAEIRTLSALRHPSIAQVYGSGTVDEAGALLSAGRLRAGSPWLAMELASGTLEEWCGALPWAEAREVLLRVLSGLAHAHAHGILHRDLKPANVLVVGAGPADGVRISDFGLASGFGLAPGRLGFAGTPDYMPPEQLEGDWRWFGPWTDLFAVGVTAVALLAGHPGSSHARPSPLGPVPAGWSEWLERAICADPALRFRHAADAAAALGALPSTVRPELQASALRRDRPTAVTWNPSAEAVTAPLPSQPSSGLLVPEADGGPIGEPRGRDAELAALQDAMDATAGGRGCVVHVTGPEGVGKSRLVRWFAAGLAERGTATVVGMAGTRSRLPSRPVELARTAVGALGLAGPELERHLERRLASVHASEAEVLSRALESGSGNVADRAAWRVLSVLAEERPVVLVLDDRYGGLAAAESAAVLGQLLATSPAPVLVIAISDELAPPVLPEARSVRVGPLSLEAMVDWLVEEMALDAEAARAVAERGHGNLALVHGWLRTWRDRGQLTEGPDGGLRLRIAPGDDVFQSATALAQARLAEVLATGTPDATRALELAAVAGPLVHLGAWMDACGADGCRPDLAQLQTWVQREVLAAAGPDHVVFQVPLLRDALLERVNAAGRRQVTHARLADAWERREDPLEIGRHLAGAGHTTRALELLLRGAAESLREGRAEDALRYLDGTNECGGPRNRVLGLRVRALHGVHRIAEAVDAAEQVNWGALSLDDRVEGSVAWSSSLVRLGRPMAAADVLERLGRTVEESGMPGLVGRICYQRARAEWYAGRPGNADRILREHAAALPPDTARPLWRELADQRMQAGAHEEAEAVLSEHLADRTSDAAACVAWGNLRRHQRRLDEAAVHYAQAATLLGPSHELFVLQVNLAMLAMERADTDLAPRLAALLPEAWVFGHSLLEAIVSVAWVAVVAPIAPPDLWFQARQVLERWLPAARDLDSARALELGAERAADAGHPDRAAWLAAAGARLRAWCREGGPPPIATVADLTPGVRGAVASGGPRPD